MASEADGSAQADTADAGNPGASTAATTTNGSPGGGAATDWLAVFQGEGNRAVVEAKGWKTDDDIVSSYRGLEAKIGQISSKALTLPSDDAKPEDWDAFYAKTGRPEKPEGYEFKLPEGLPDNFPYDDTSATKFKNWAHAAGVMPRQAQAIHDAFVKDTAERMEASLQAEVKVRADAHDALVKAWGDPTSEAYKRNTELANRTLRQQGGEPLIHELKAIGALADNGDVRTPLLAQMLARTGQALFAEDTLFAGPGNVPNPFSEKSENMTEQGSILRRDPQRARQLIISAGLDPKEWGLT